MLKCRINASSESLTKLHAKYPWIPSGSDVRPSVHVLTQKAKDMSQVMFFYESLRDYLLEDIFGISTEINANGKCFVRKLPTSFFELDSNLTENKYPYQVADKTKHYVLWYPMFSREATLSDFQITRDITRHLIRISGEFNLNFVWYVNPKMTITNLFHVQVFVHQGSNTVVSNN